MSRSRRPQRSASDSNSSSTSTSPDRGVDDDNDSFMLHANDSSSSLALSISQDTSDSDMARQMAERYRLSPVSRLPAELMIGIFSKIASAADLKSCMLVSKDWARNSVALLWHRPQTNKWQSVNTVAKSVMATNGYFDYANLIRRLNLSTLAPEIADGTLWPLSTCKRIERLTLTNCISLTDQSLVRMIEGNRSLLALDVTGLHQITDRTMMTVAANCVRLQGLNVTNCRKLTDASLQEVARNCRHVKRLKFNGCSQLTDKSILTFAEHCHQILEIDLHGCNLLEDDSVTALIMEGRHLRELRLSHCSNITDQAFLRLPVDATYESLRILDLTECGELMDAGVARIINAAPRLRNLVLNKCRLITDRAINSIIKLGKNLHYIHLGHCARITDAGVQQLVKVCNRIRYIDFACCTNLTDASVQRLADLPKLKRIGLVKCHNITDRSLQALAMRSREGQRAVVGPSSLERVHLSYCTNLTLAGIVSLLNCCPRLTHLSLTGVHAFLREDLVVFCREAPPEFNDHQRDVFCVFSGHGVSRLRNYLNADVIPGAGFDTDGTMYDDNIDDAEDDGLGDDEDGDTTGIDHTVPPAPPGLGFFGVGVDAQGQRTPDIVVNIGGTPSPLSAASHTSNDQQQTPTQQLQNIVWQPVPPPPSGNWHVLGPDNRFYGAGGPIDAPMHPEQQVTDMMGAVDMQDEEMDDPEPGRS